MDPRLQLDADEAAPWWRALALHERDAASASRTPATLERGRARLEEWRDELGLTATVLERWLDAASLDEPTLHALLGEDDASLQARIAPPTWLIDLVATLASSEVHEPLPSDLWAGTPPAGAGFLPLLAPLLGAGRARLRARLAPHGWASALDERDVLRPICTRLATLLERPLALELQAAALLGALGDGDPAAQYAAFVSSLDAPEEQTRLLQEYPVLARTALDWIAQWVDAVGELADAWATDHARIERTFGDIGDPTRLVGVDSDPHRFGRHVWFVDTASGTRIVHKPRPCAVELAFGEHVDALVADGLRPDLRTLRVVDGGEHGWIEFAEAAPIGDADAAARFHQRQGAWLPVLWTLACTDVHYENIIASGEHPVPVDHETLLRNRMFVAAAEDADLRAEELLGDTVFGVDLLPAPRFDAGFGGAIDQGGMGAGYDETGTIAIPRIVDAGTTSMRIDVAPIDPDRQPNRASHADDPLDPRDHADDVEDGFDSAWGHLVRHASDVAASLDRFTGAVVRVILRPTQHYLTLLETLGHPEFLGDALERERALLELCMYPDDQAWRRPTTEHERRQLLVGDVPWFGARSGDGALLTGDGAELADVLVRSGIDVARERLASIADDAQLDRNQWIVRASLARWGGGRSVADRAIAGDTAELARAIAQRLLDVSVPADGRRSWLTLETVPGQRPELARLRPDRIGSDLYDGLPGVAMFLATCGDVLDEPDLLRAAREAAATLVARGMRDVQGIGAYDGAAGIMWSSLLLADRLDDDSLRDHAETAAIELARRLAHDRVFDVISGAAGCIPVLLELDRHRPGAVQLATDCATHLVANVDSPEQLMFARGFSHGATGIAWSLARLTAATGEERWLAHAIALLEAEDALLARDRWTAEDDDGRRGLAAWCHGAPGIALGRFEVAHAYADLDLTVARAALDATIHSSRHDSHGICHGELGTVEVLDLVGAHDERDRRAARVIDELHATGPRCTTPRHLETPGLMTGLAGIGWQLLRLAAPDRVPSVLLPGSLSAPRRAPAPRV